MSKNLNKLQIRAELLNAIKALASGDKHTQSFLSKIIEPLLEIEDKNTILDILIKEITANPDNNRFLILSFLIESLVPKEMLEAELWKLLELPHINDTAKSNIINILRDLGNQINYEKYTEYFENPESVIDADTTKMLQSAIVNPEALIDFLDFIEALPAADRTILIDSLCEDYKGDELANLFAPVLYANPNSELCSYAIERLGDSKSSLAIHPLNFIIEYTNNPQFEAAAKKSLNILKLAGAREDNSKEFYCKAYENSKIDDVYISMPDGHGNSGILISRKRDNKDSVQMFAVVFNDTSGIIDCFGFNDITTNEFNAIVNRFYENQEKIYLTPSTAKFLLDNAEKRALKHQGRVSYEFVCWKRLLCDIKPILETEEEVLSKNLEKTDITINDLKKLYNSTVFDKWFLYNSNNSAFNELLEQISNLLQTNTETSKITEEIDKLCSDYLFKVWSDEDVKHIDYRLLLSAYLLNLNGIKGYANIMYSIIFNQEIKNELLKNILRISIYEFLLREKGKHLNANISTNIFSRRNEANKILIDKKTLDNVIRELETLWSV